MIEMIANRSHRGFVSSRLQICVFLSCALWTGATTLCGQTEFRPSTFSETTGLRLRAPAVPSRNLLAPLPQNPLPSQGEYLFGSGIQSNQPIHGTTTSPPVEVFGQSGGPVYEGGFSISPGQATSRQSVQDNVPPRAENMRTEILPPLIEIDEDLSPPEGSEVIIQRYDDGKPKIIRHVTQDEQGNYFNHGPWLVRGQEGRVIAAGNYVQGLMHGQWRRIHSRDSSGLFSTKPFNLFQSPYLSVAQFNDGKLDGVWTIYDRYQQKIFEISYRRGVRHGAATWYYPNQAKMRQATFKNGLIDGEILDWNDSEKLLKRQQYVDGRRVIRNTSMYRPNVKHSEEYFLGPKLEPEDEDDWWEAKPTPYLARGSETQNGPAMEWYENGQPRKRGQFKDGKPVGQFTWWHANGNKQIEGFYVDGQKNRRWTWWFENGFKRVEGEFENDQPVNIWRAWYEDGQLRKENDYSGSSESTTQDEPEDLPASGNNPGTLELIEPIVEELPAPGVDENPPSEENDPAAEPRSSESNPSETTDANTPNGFRAPNIPGKPAVDHRPDAEGGQIDLTSEEPFEEIGGIPEELFEDESPGNIGNDDN